MQVFSISKIAKTRKKAGKNYNYMCNCNCGGGSGAPKCQKQVTIKSNKQVKDIYTK